MYNNSEYLYESLGSVFSQSLDNLELIISDDGSSQLDKEAIYQFVERNKSPQIVSVKYNFNNCNMGTVKHLETVRFMAEGEFITVMAADDAFCDESAIENFNRLFNLNVGSNPNAPITIRTTSKRVDVRGWVGADDYFKTIIKNVYGKKSQGMSELEKRANKAIAKIRSGVVKAGLGASLKVLGTQLSSYGAASSVIEWKYLFFNDSLIYLLMNLSNSGLISLCSGPN